MMSPGFDVYAAIALVIGLVVVLASAWATAIERQQKLKASPDVTGRLPEMYARPAATRRKK